MFYKREKYPFTIQLVIRAQQTSTYKGTRFSTCIMVPCIYNNITSFAYKTNFVCVNYFLNQILFYYIVYGNIQHKFPSFIEYKLLVYIHMLHINPFDCNAINCKSICIDAYPQAPQSYNNVEYKLLVHVLIFSIITR